MKIHSTTKCYCAVNYKNHFQEASSEFKTVSWFKHISVRVTLFVFNRLFHTNTLTSMVKKDTRNHALK